MIFTQNKLVIVFVLLVLLIIYNIYFNNHFETFSSELETKIDNQMKELEYVQTDKNIEIINKDDEFLDVNQFKELIKMEKTFNFDFEDAEKYIDNYFTSLKDKEEIKPTTIKDRKKCIYNFLLSEYIDTVNLVKTFNLKKKTLLKSKIYQVV